MDKDAYNNLLDALSRVFKSFPPSLTESGDDKGHRSDSDNPEPPRKATITIMTVGKARKSTSAIPRFKDDKMNDGNLGSGKRGGKGE